MSRDRAPGAFDPTGQAARPTPAGIADRLRQAVALHTQGQLAQAERLYREILGQSPDHFDALHMLGVLEHQNGRHESAAKLIRRAIGIDPAFPLAHLNLGNALRELKRPAEALASYDRALGLKPDYGKALCNRGIALQDLGRPAEALVSYDRALAFGADNVEALVNRGVALRDLKRPAEALASYDRALAITPGNVVALYNRGNALISLGRPDEALAAYAKVLETDSSHKLSWVGFAESLRATNRLSANHVPLVLMALNSKFLDPQNVAPVAAEIVWRDPMVEKFARWTGDPQECARRLETAIADGSIAALFEVPMLLAVLGETIIPDCRLEAFLVILRRVLLSAMQRSSAAVESKSGQRFTAALALQCFANEYVFAESATEGQQVAALMEKITRAIDAQQPVPAVWVNLLGAYRALYKTGFAGQIEAALEAGHPVREVIRRQVTEPVLEEQIKPEIKSITNTTDGVSRKVRQQYEESPYPRWRRRSMVDSLSLQAFLRRSFPEHAISDDFPANPDLLVAGCGTGSHPVQTARRFPHAKILALDLSVASLAYAKRATAELGITNIEYVQADILELNNLDRRFDVIESIGVLHHLRDPLEGWRILTALLRPGGYFKIGLYSARARREITAAREFIRQRGYGSGVEGIRECRQAIMNGDAGPRVEAVTKLDDFYSASCCRDLLFHVQEQHFSPDGIQKGVAELGLKFLGFELPNGAVRMHYRARFPADVACDSLANWELFEEENPATFSGMYQFWARKN